MNDSTIKQEQPAGLMGTQFALNVSQGVVKALEEGNATKNQVQQWIFDQKTVEEIAKNITREILGLTADPWIEEKKRNEVFYKKYFNNRAIDWSKISLPAKNEKMNRLEPIFSDITEDEEFEAY